MITMNSASQDFQKLEHFLDEKITGKLTPGVQFLVADASGTLFEYNRGIADFASSGNVVPATQFKMYSATKLLTMIAIMKLIEQGKVSLDSAVSEYIPYNFPDSVTIRRLLSHTAGCSRYPFVKQIHLDTEDSAFNYTSFMSEMIPRHSKLKYKPGKKHMYSNFGIMLLSTVVETVSGFDYKEYIADSIIEPLSLADDEYVGFEFTPHTATAYQKRGTLMHWLFSMMVDTDKYYGEKFGRWQSYEKLYMEGIGFGGGFANARGFAKLFVALLRSEIINAKSLSMTFEPQTYGNGKISKNSLGWWRGKDNRAESFYHPGGGGGYSCELRVYPETGLVRVMMMNKTQTFGDLKMFSEIDKLWLK